ncbi:MAG: hypothetical protein V3T14_09835 [Myxococcota bacterium]
MENLVGIRAELVLLSVVGPSTGERQRTSSSDAGGLKGFLPFSPALLLIV